MYSQTNETFIQEIVNIYRLIVRCDSLCIYVFKTTQVKLQLYFKVSTNNFHTL